MGIDLGELWRYRELIFILGWRDVQVKYKQMSIGVLWAVIRPVLTMVVFTVIFGKVANLPSGGVPYPILTFAGLLPWQLFSNCLSDINSSVVRSGGMVTKIYFPRLVLPVGAIVSSLVDFLIACGILAALMAWYGIAPTPAVILLPLFLLLTLLAALGIGLWFAALNVEYHDFAYVVPFFISLGMFVSPVAYSTNVIPESWRALYSLNPMVGAIDGFRWALLGQNFLPNWNGLMISAVVMMVLLVTGAFYFRKTERAFADVI